MTNKRHPWDKEKKELILSRDNHECFYCGATKDLAIDHIIPISKGGDNTMGNLVTSCKSCNSQKHAANLLPVFYNQVKECVEDRNLSMGIPQDELAVIVPSEKALLNAGLFGQKGAGSPDYNPELYFPSGALRYQYRTREDRLRYCGYTFGWGKGEDGQKRAKSEFRCKLPECERCMSIRKNQRADDFSSRLDTVSGPLYHLTVTNDRELKRLREWAYKHNYDYLCLPTESNEREVFINGPRRGASLIAIDDAKTIAVKLSSVIYLDKSKKASGSLGK